MPRTAELRVNVFKKVRIRNQWVLCPAVPERSGRFLDRVRGAGEIEMHHEGTYYLEWREDGLRRRQAIPADAEPHYHAQIKEAELRTASLGLSKMPESIVPPAEPPQVPSEDPPHGSPDPASAAQQLMQSMALFMQQMAGTTPSAVRKPILHECQPLASSFVAHQGRSAPTAPVTQPISPSHPSATVIGSIDAFLKDVEPPQREWKTYEEYRNVLYYFRDQTTKVYVKDVGRDDCLEFMRYLYSIGNEARTVFNRIGIVLHWLRLNGITRVLEKGDKPNYVENRREMYQQEDLEALFRACNPDEKIRYLFFLLTGERDKEVRYTAWSDIDFKRRCVWVTSKKQLGFKPKDKEE